MGMSASQARYLSLVARQSNLEYQGQQINQERTVLSDQCTALYNSLLAMTVPTPPSTSDYTTVQYTGTDGASTFTLGSIIPSGDTYTLEMKYSKTGHYLEEAGTSAVTTVDATINLKIASGLTTTTSTYYDQPSSNIGTEDVTGKKVMCKVASGYTVKTNEGEQLYELKDGKFVQISSEDNASNKNNLYVERTATKDTETGETNYASTDYIVDNLEQKSYTSGGIQASDRYNYYAVEDGKAVRIDASNADTYFEKLGDGTYGVKSDAQNKVYEKTTSGGSTFDNPDYSTYNYYVEGQPCMSLSQALSSGRIGSSATYNNYIEAIKDAYPEYSESTNAEIEADFQVYFTKNSSGLQVPHFVMTTDLESGMTDATGSKYVTSYDYSANGTYTSTVKQDQCQLTFDTSGRITEIKIPKTDDAGNILGYKSIEVEAETVTDENAYQDAYNQYEYAQYEYDKEQQEINAKTEVIQQEDRNLELKLTRLDNERTQITTEIEAVQKVIDDNIEASYKTFSG